MRLDPGQTGFYCAGEGSCQMVGTVEWPPDSEAIWAALAIRPVPGTRNWYPAGYEEAVRLGLPHGQTAADLRDETRQYEEMI